MGSSNFVTLVTDDEGGWDSMHATTFTPDGDQILWLDVPAAPTQDVPSGPARVYIHGLGATGAAAFGEIAPHPELAGRRFLIVDLPGHGLSDRPQDFGFTLDDHARAVAAILDAEGLGGVELVGHSLGGSIAIVLAARRPELVARLVVAEANLDPLPPSPTGQGSQQISSQTEADWIASGYATLVATNPDWAPTLRLCDALAVHRSAVGIVTGSRPTMRELLIALPIPRTFIHGDRGEALRDREGLKAAGVRVVEIADAGHSMMVDQPDAFARAIADALTS
jgi:pimeloyl-ACP methyl ester carboxylesterase